MAMPHHLLVACIALNKMLLPWSVVFPQSLSITQFRGTSRSVQAGKYVIVKTSTELTAAVLFHVFNSSYAIVNNEKMACRLMQYS